MTKDIYTDPLGRKYHRYNSADIQKAFDLPFLEGADDNSDVLIPYHEPDDKREFPSSPRFDDYYSAVSSGAVIHEVEREQVYGPHLPQRLQAKMMV